MQALCHLAMCFVASFGRPRIQCERAGDSLVAGAALEATAV